MQETWCSAQECARMWMSRYAFTWWGNVDKISIHQFGWRCFVGDLIVHTCLHPIKCLLLRRTCVYRMEFLLCRNDAAAAFPRRMRHLHSWWYAEGAFAWRFLAGRALLCPGVTGCGLVPAVASWREFPGSNWGILKDLRINLNTTPAPTNFFYNC